MLEIQLCPNIFYETTTLNDRFPNLETTKDARKLFGT